MATYRVIATSITGTRIAELQLNGLSFGSVLNGAGELSGRLPLPEGDPEAARALVDAVDPVRRQLVVERDGAVVWCGIVWAAGYDDESRSVDVRAAETWSYYRRRTVATKRVYPPTDQLTIARQLLLDAHAETGGDIGVTVPARTCGVTRTYVAEVWERKNVADEVEGLALDDDGFDFSIDAAWTTAGALAKTFRFHYPRRGRRFAETGHVFEVGRNVISWDWPVDGTRYANRVIVTGAGTDALTKSSTRSDADQITAGYPLVEVVEAQSQEAVQANLAARARALLRLYARPVVIPSVVVRGDIDPVFGAWQVGDACRFVCQPGLSPRFPDGLDDYRRIVGYEVSVSDEGTDEVRLDLGPEDNA